MATSTSTTMALPNLSAAQIMADLDSLNKCDPTAAIALLKASSKITPRELRRKSRASILPDPPKFDHLGKRIVPPLSRMDSSSSATGIRGNVSDESGNKESNMGVAAENDVDMQRAKELLSLFEKKENFRQMGTVGLDRVKEKVDEVMQNNAQKQLDGKQKAASERYRGA